MAHYDGAFAQGASPWCFKRLERERVRLTKWSTTCATAFSGVGCGSGNGTARLWLLQVDELIDLACRTAGRNLTRREWMQYFPGEPYRPTCPDLPVPGE
jgi:hypothetical protein